MLKFDTFYRQNVMWNYIELSQKLQLHLIGFGMFIGISHQMSL